MSKTATEYRQERADVIRKAQQFNEEKADSESGLLSAEDQAAFDQMMADADDLLRGAKTQDALAAAAASLTDIPEPPAGGKRQSGGSPVGPIMLRAGHDDAGRPKYEAHDPGVRGSAAYRDAIAAYMRGNISSEQYAALQSDDAEQAGFLLASEQLTAGILREVDDLLFVRRYATVHTVREADSLGIRKRTSRLQTWGWSSELTVSNDDNSLKLGKKVLTPHHLTGEALISRDLLRRSSRGAEAIVREEMGRDAGEVMEDAYLTGHGAQQPLGVFTASDDGISTARDVQTGSATSITADGLLDAKYSLKSQYRNGSRGGVRWLFHRDGIKIIAKLKDADGHYMFRPGQGVKGDEMWDDLLGYPVDESERTPNTFTAGQYVGLLANWRYYEIADALSMEMQVLNELHAKKNQVGIIGRLKTDGMPTLEEAFVRLRTN